MDDERERYLESSDPHCHTCNDQSVVLYQLQQFVKAAIDVLKAKQMFLAEDGKHCCALHIGFILLLTCIKLGQM